MTLRVVGGKSPEPDKGVVEAAEQLLADAKAGKVAGLFCILEVGQCDREVLLAGSLDVDGIAGFSARVLASLANGE